MQNRFWVSRKFQTHRTVLAWLAVSPVFIYAGLLLYIYLEERSLLFKPQVTTMTEAQAKADKAGLSEWKNEAGDYIGWRLRSETPAAAALLVLPNASQGCALDEVQLMQHLHSTFPADIYLLEYPGYGPRPGEASKAGTLLAAESAFSLLPGDLPLYVISDGMGAGPAASLAREYPSQVRGLLMFAPFDTAYFKLQDNYAWVPLDRLLEDRFEPVKYLKNYHGILIEVRPKGYSVPVENLQQDIFRQYLSVKSQFLVTNKVDLSNGDYPDDWWKAITGYMQQYQVWAVPANKHP